MSNELRERIAELLELLRPATPSEAADAILALPGIAVVELPEPDDPSPPGEDERLRSPLAQWGGESGADFVASVWHLGEVQINQYVRHGWYEPMEPISPGEVQINQYVRHGWYEPMEPISPADARQFALALLAAAEYAEREQ